MSRAIFALFLGVAVAFSKDVDRPTPKLLSLAGVFAPIPTPFKPDGSLDLDALTTNFAIWNKHPLRGHTVLGTVGEFPFMSWEDKLTLVKEVKRQIPKDRLLIVNTGGIEGTMEQINFAEEVAKIGADAILAPTPFYYKNRMTGKALENHFNTLAAASPIPVIIYNEPEFTGVDMEVETIVNLSRHQNIIGLKTAGKADEGAARLSEIVRKTMKEGFQVVAKSANFFLPALEVGCVGSMAALTTVLPKEMCELYRLFTTGDLVEAGALQARLIQPNAMVTRVYGVAGLKLAMDKAGFRGGPVRLPLLPLTTFEETELTTIFQRNGFTKFDI